MKNVFSVDIEDFFQVEAFSGFIKPGDWDSYETRVVRNTLALLDILLERNITGTFFILGWIAERHTGLVSEIATRGHEIGSHGYSHTPINRMTKKEFREDVKRSKRILEDICGQPVRGYRAPTFSVMRDTSWALDIIHEEGFLYDSSIFPVKHDRYGWREFPNNLQLLPSGLYELPMASLELFGIRVPVGGGGYFRLYPYAVTKYLLSRINNGGNPFVFFIHPWEIDPGQPRLNVNGMLKRFRHYHNISQNMSKLSRVLDDFTFQPAWESIRSANLSKLH